MLGINRNSLSYKTALVYIVMAVFIISIFNFMIWESQSDLIINNQKLAIESISNRLRNLIETDLSDVDSSGAVKQYDVVAKKAVDIGMSKTIVYSDGGDILYSFNEDKSSVSNTRELVLVNRSIVRFELEKKNFLHHTDLLTGTVNLYIPTYLSRLGATVVVKFVLPFQELKEKKEEVLYMCLWVAVLIVMLQILMAIFLSRLIIRPISKLVQMTRKVAEGDLKQQIKIKQKDEIGILAAAYNEMIINLDRMHNEAKGANPLTGLPGNLAIMRTIDDRFKRREAIAVIYGDLDNFKAYNDTYGLNKGDEAILHCRDSFINAADESGDETTFVGHEGGDDFVTVTSFQTWEAVAQKTIDYFDANVPRFYNAQHNQNGYIDAKDRQGNAVRYPLMSLSLAVVSNHFRQADDHRILIQWAAEMKKVVKKMKGSAYAIDKRRR